MGKIESHNNFEIRLLTVFGKIYCKIIGLTVNLISEKWTFHMKFTEKNVTVY